MQLSEFLANDTVKNEIYQAMRSGTLPHAIIIDGAKGTGKTTLAEIIARYCVCLSESNKPCGECSGCIKAVHNSHPDIYRADGNNVGELNVDSIRKIRSDVYIKPNEANTKVYLLLNCDKMLAPAQNAFLKVLEEPPANVVFIMTVTSANMMLQTVRSRSRIYSLYPVTVEQAAQEAAKKFPEKNYQEILKIAEMCDGNIGQTIQILESGGEEAKKLADEIFSAIPQKNEYLLLTLTSRLSISRTFASSVLDCMLENASECIKAAVGIRTNVEFAEEIARRMTKKRIYRLAENTEKAKEILNTNVNLNFFGTWLCSVLRG